MGTRQKDAPATKTKRYSWFFPAGSRHSRMGVNKTMKLLNWIVVVAVCGVSAYYLNWIAYGPAVKAGGSLRGVLELGLKWYGLPAALVVQLAIWFAMPRLFGLSPSPWIAAMIWPFISAICKVIIIWNIKRPTGSDVVTIVGLAVTTIIAWALKVKGI